jgi:hypothetical protein
VAVNQSINQVCCSQQAVRQNVGASESRRKHRLPPGHGKAGACEALACGSLKFVTMLQDAYQLVARSCMSSFNCYQGLRNSWLLPQSESCLRVASACPGLWLYPRLLQCPSLRVASCPWQLATCKVHRVHLTYSLEPYAHYSVSGMHFSLSYEGPCKGAPRDTPRPGVCTTWGRHTTGLNRKTATISVASAGCPKMLGNSKPFRRTSRQDQARLP